LRILSDRIPGKTLGRALKEAKYSGIVGDVFAGVVEELGPAVPEGMWTVSDSERVAGLVLFSSQFSLSHFPPTLLLGTERHTTAETIEPTAHSWNT
jgi:hypothetical protein